MTDRRDPRFAELDRLIAEDKPRRGRGRPPGPNPHPYGFSALYRREAAMRRRGSYKPGKGRGYALHQQNGILARAKALKAARTLAAKRKSAAREQSTRKRGDDLAAAG